MNITPSVGIVVIKDNEILLVREGEKSGHITGMYGLPAGRIEENETPIQAAIRELREETGLETTEEDLIGLSKKYEADIKRKSGETVHFYHTVFVCKHFTGQLHTSEDVTPEWVNLENLNKYDLLPNIEDMVKQAQKYLSIAL